MIAEATEPTVWSVLMMVISALGVLLMALLSFAINKFAEELKANTKHIYVLEGMLTRSSTKLELKIEEHEKRIERLEAKIFDFQTT